MLQTQTPSRTQQGLPETHLRDLYKHKNLPWNTSEQSSKTRKASRRQPRLHLQSWYCPSHPLGMRGSSGAKLGLTLPRTCTPVKALCGWQTEPGFASQNGQIQNCPCTPSLLQNTAQSSVPQSLSWASARAAVPSASTAFTRTKCSFSWGSGKGFSGITPQELWGISPCAA